MPVPGTRQQASTPIRVGARPAAPKVANSERGAIVECHDIHPIRMMSQMFLLQPLIVRQAGAVEPAQQHSQPIVD